MLKKKRITSSYFLCVSQGWFWTYSSKCFFSLWVGDTLFTFCYSILLWQNTIALLAPTGSVRFPSRPGNRFFIWVDDAMAPTWLFCMISFQKILVSSFLIQHKANRWIPKVHNALSQNKGILRIFFWILPTLIWQNQTKSEPIYFSVIREWYHKLCIIMLSELTAMDEKEEQCTFPLDPNKQKPKLCLAELFKVLRRLGNCMFLFVSQLVAITRTALLPCPEARAVSLHLRDYG